MIRVIFLELLVGFDRNHLLFGVGPVVNAGNRDIRRQLLIRLDKHVQVSESGGPALLHEDHELLLRDDVVLVLVENLERNYPGLPPALSLFLLIAWLSLASDTISLANDTTSWILIEEPGLFFENITIFSHQKYPIIGLEPCLP